MFDPKKFTTPTAKPLPVVLLLDVSSSMSGDKIENLNKAVEDMLDTFAQEEKMETEILVSVITFGNQVELQVPYTKASQVQWQGLQANGYDPDGNRPQNGQGHDRGQGDHSVPRQFARLLSLVFRRATE